MIFEIKRNIDNLENFDFLLKDDIYKKESNFLEEGLNEISEMRKKLDMDKTRINFLSNCTTSKLAISNQFKNLLDSNKLPIKTNSVWNSLVNQETKENILSERKIGKKSRETNQSIN